MDWDSCDVTLVRSCLVTGRLAMSLVTSRLLTSLMEPGGGVPVGGEPGGAWWRGVLWKSPCKDFFKGKCYSCQWLK